MTKLPADEKNALSATIQTQLNEMTTLKAKINADTDLATLRVDVQSITKAYRIYMLVIPQGRIMAAADRAMTLADTANTLGAKLEARIAAAKTAGNDVSAEEATYADFQTKIADAQTQAAAATSEVATLTPDNGNDSTK